MTTSWRSILQCQRHFFGNRLCMKTSVYLSGRNVCMCAGILGFLPRFFQYLVFEVFRLTDFLIAWPTLKIRLLSQMFHFSVSGFQSLESGQFVSSCVWSVKLYSQWQGYCKGNIFLWCKRTVSIHVLICFETDYRRTNWFSSVFVILKTP